MPHSDVAFTASVKAIQAEKGSREHFEAMEANDVWRHTVTPDLAERLAQTFSFYLATASAAGQPYIQHRGGPPGFLKVLDAQRLGFADFAGNRQYVTLGNLAENPRAYIFAMDYQNRRRVKIWGSAVVVEDDPELIRAVTVPGYRARVERAIVFTIAAWDTNCPQHIPQLIPAGPVSRLIAAQDARIADLEAEVARLKSD